MIPQSILDTDHVSLYQRRHPQVAAHVLSTAAFIRQGGHHGLDGFQVVCQTPDVGFVKEGRKSVRPSF